jgi:hypothetical protein
LRWQVERDLAHEPESVWQLTRARVTVEGFGAQLLARQDEDGLWAGGAYFPADATKDEPGQPWTATTWSLNALREWGVEADALRPDTATLLARNARWEYDDLPYWGGEVDACINGYTLANGAWLGADVSSLADWFMEHQLGDGGWNCAWVDGSERSSFHSTLNALDGILDYESVRGRAAAARCPAPRRGVSPPAWPDATLEHRGDHGPWATHLAYPYRWCYSVLRAADYSAPQPGTTVGVRMGAWPRPLSSSARPATRTGPGTSSCVTKAGCGSTWIPVLANLEVADLPRDARAGLVGRCAGRES